MSIQRDVMLDPRFFNEAEIVQWCEDNLTQDEYFLDERHFNLVLTLLSEEAIMAFILRWE